jgi:parallel beta-helix repeat protein
LILQEVEAKNMKKQFLIIGLVFLLLFSSVFPISIGYDLKIPDNKELSYNRGNTLYVGGSGLNNYSKIQDAIDNASNGDIVFVYAGTYYEKIEIPKSIALLGENVNLTIIDIDHIYPQPQGGIVMYVINAPNVTIDGFSFRNHFSIDITGGIWAENCLGLTISNISDSWHHSVDFGFRLISSNNSLITHTFIKFKTESAIDIQDSLNVTISDNFILGSGGYLDHDCGISLIDSENITITNNSITKFVLYGISLLNSDKNNLVRNNLQYNYASGIYLLSSNYNLISNNELSFNYVKGIFIDNSKHNIINKNDIYNNGEKYIFFCNAFLNKWNANFWGYSSSKIHIINGEMNFIEWNISFPILKFDWNPAKEPYDI